MKSKNRLLGLGALVLGSLIFMAWLAGLLTWGKIPPGTVALKAPAARGKIITVQEVGIPRELTVMATVMSRTLTQVSSQVPGRVSRIWVEAGSRVKSGDPLVALAAPEYQARVSQARAGTAQARAHLAQAEADYRRYQRLLKEEAVSPREFEAMEARYRAARAAVAQTQAQVQEAAAFKDYTVVRAPRTGVVAERRAALGDLAQPGQTLVSLYDPQDLQIEGEVNDDYRPQILLGLSVQVTVPAVSWEAESALSEIFPISAPGSRTFKVRTRPVAHEGLAPGMFARLRLPLGETRGILIPREAVRQVGQLPMVEVVHEQTTELRLVKLGRQVGQQVEVLSGLQAGEQILLP